MIVMRYHFSGGICLLENTSVTRHIIYIYIYIHTHTHIYIYLRSCDALKYELFIRVCLMSMSVFLCVDKI